MAQVKIKGERILSDEKYTLKEIAYELQRSNGENEDQKRLVYDHGNAVSALLYNKEKGTVILTEQFRIATFLNGNKTGNLLETPAGLLEKDESPDDAIKREILEETGFEINSLEKVLEVYSSAGAITGCLFLFVAPYTDEQKVAKGGGLKEEGEDVKVVELTYAKAIAMMDSGEIKDAKTIMLLQYAHRKNLVS